MELNKIFSNLTTYAKNNGAKIRTVKNGLSLKDTILYALKSTEKGKTKTSVTSDINFNKCKKNETPKNRTLYYKKNKNIPLIVYKKIRIDVYKLCKKICKKSIIDDDSILELIPVSTDGTVTHTKIDSNSKELELSTNMGYYLNTYQIPIDLTYNGPQRNNEVENLINFISENKLKNLIYVCDRAYFSYNLFNFINNNNASYIIRIDNNSILYSKDKNKINNRKNKMDINEVINNSRIIKKVKQVTQNVTVKGKIRKQFVREVTLVIATNLVQKDDNGKYIYSDEEILKQYKNRWDVEIYFKFIKNCFNFEEQKGVTFDENQKINECILILSYICKIITNIYEQQNSFEKEFEKEIKVYKNNKLIKTKITYTKKINQTLVMDGIFKHLLDSIVDGKLRTKNLNDFMNNYIVLIVNEKDKSNERTCKTPFKKWYIKQYSIRYMWTKILDAVEKNTIDKLNKNLKLIARDIKKIIKTGNG